ncbi:thioesterase family protein [Micromonospora craniellae]|uniref:Thioesterase n=1 Tax=Micromonospora craniellae TaxID=2294034 RepID=A0A372G0A7_9ACTN|nr:thioesterase family protein [Micromonospora craniellae]QOC91716.1 thioesterase family protein [Micromonospora craniellae]RFS46507.1 thioesterase [Micromonospora craniellae]
MTSAPTAPLTVLVGRPRYEGANIRTWIGFKHFIYLVEEAVLQWLRDRGPGARDLFHSHGLGVEIVDCSVQLPAVLEVDDEVRVEVDGESAGRLTVRMTVFRDGREQVVLRGKVRVALVVEPAATTSAPAPAHLADLVVPTLGAAATVARPDHRPIRPGETVADVLTPVGSRSFLWTWRAPYFYCHFSDRVQHSGYVRALEEVVDRFLAARGISVGRLVRERSWIPVVSRARVRMVEAARMEEDVHTVLTVTDVLRGVMFDARMDCYVRRGERLVHTATASILHGYAISAGPQAGELAEFDDEVLRALAGGVA